LREVGGACSTHESYEKCIKILIGKPEGRRPLGRPRRTWENNISMDLRITKWMHLAQGRDHWRAVVKTVMNLRVP
jgi:hypothetical protein